MKAVILHQNSASSHGLALLLEKYEDFDVVAEVSDPEEVDSALSVHEPILVLLNTQFSELPLEDNIRQLKETCPESAIVVITETEDWDHLDSSIRAGASAFVSMKTAPEELALCLRLASDGHVLVSTPQVTSLSDLLEGEDRIVSDPDGTIFTVLAPRVVEETVPEEEEAAGEGEAEVGEGEETEGGEAE